MAVNAPKSGGNSTAIIQWTLSCLGFIGIAILEYALILGVKKDKNPSEVDVEEKIGLANKNRSDAMFNRLDKIMIVILPSTFLAFAAIFWKVHSTVAVDY